MTARRILRTALAAAVSAAAPVAAQVAPFDLDGPRLAITVTHDKQVLPIAAVPHLAAGDRLTITAELPPDQSAHYLLVVAFLRGATNPPPKKWFAEAETWKAKKRTLTVTVPEGAQQALVFLAPATGGDFGTLTDAVRGRPGAFVRASQDLNQASLDRARLDAYVAAINRRDAEGGVRLEQVSPMLARSLSIRLKDECLLRPAELQAACLTGNSDALVLSDGHTSSIAEALTGMPTSLAYQLAATPQGGYGYYSPYIGVVRDVARLLGAFRTANYQYIPALGTRDGDGLKLLLNAVPSFGKPKSVLVAALPGVGSPAPPPLRLTQPGTAYCLTRPGLVLPVEGAPLVHATGYARDLALRVTAKDGREVDLPLTPDAEQGGFRVRIDGLRPGDFDAELTGRIHGRWGFEPFEGPRVALQLPRADGWRTAEGGGELVVGRDDAVPLVGAGAACVTGMSAKLANGQVRAVTYERPKGGGAGLVATLPLGDAPPGDVALKVVLAGLAEPATIPLRAYAEAGRVDGFTLHAGDREGVLAGARLDTVTGLALGGTRFRPGTLSRAGGGDRLTMIADGVPDGDERAARVTLADGRSLSARVTRAPARPAATLIARTVTLPDAPVAVTLPEGVVPQQGRLTFSIRARAPTRFAAGDRVEVAGGEATTIVPLRLQDDSVAVATVAPGEALGPGAAGPLRYRVMQGEAAGDWQPLGTLVRLPALRSATCGDAGCTVAGRDLFLLAGVGGVAVPEGYTGETLAVPGKAEDGRLALKLRDDAGVAASVAIR